MKDLTQPATPLLPDQELHDFVNYYFNRRNIYLKTIQTNASPLYIIESSILKERAEQFIRVVTRHFSKTSFYYAVKSNNHPAVSKILLESGFGLDVSSGLELENAINLGAGDIVFSGPGKTNQEIELALNYADRTTILLDSFGELKRVKMLASATRQSIRVGIRLTTNPNGIWRKFGILPETLLSFWEQVRNDPYVQFKGLQFHTSWNLTPDKQLEFIIFLGQIIKNMPEEFNKHVEFIDIGGGYWPCQGEWLQPAGTTRGILDKAIGRDLEPVETHFRIPGTPIEDFARILGQEIQTHLLQYTDSRICFEPGRWICNDAIHILLTVVDKKNHDLVITDAGTNAIGWERFETDYFPVLNLTRDLLKENSCNILGSLCTPHDIWGYTYFGKDIQEGDILMIPCQGAYTYSLNQNFIKPLPKVIII